MILWSSQKWYAIGRKVYVRGGFRLICFIYLRYHVGSAAVCALFGTSAAGERLRLGQPIPEPPQAHGLGLHSCELGATGGKGEKGMHGCSDLSKSHGQDGKWICELCWTCLTYIYTHRLLRCGGTPRSAAWPTLSLTKCSF